MVRVNTSNQVEKREQVREDGIFTDSFGGLNTTATNLNCPYEDSPDLLNVDIDVSGRVTKRRGTKTLANFVRTASKGYALIPFTTPLNYSFVLEKDGTDLLIQYINNDVVTNVITKSNVWDADAVDIKPSWAVSSELIPKIFLATGVDSMVRVSIIEVQYVADGTEGGSLDFSSTLMTNAATANTVIFKNRELDTSGTLSGTTLTIAGITNGDVYDAVYITWQWCAEAYSYLGEDFYDVESRFNSVITEQTVPIPRNIRWGATGIDDYPIRAYTESRYSSPYTFDITRTPATVNEYSFSNGARYTAGEGETQATPFFITFGDVSAMGGDVDSVHFARFRNLDLVLNNSALFTSSTLRVFVNDAQQGIFGGAGGDPVRVYLTARLSDQDTASAGNWLSFTAADEIGVPPQASVKVVSLIRKIGSAAVNDVAITPDIFGDGYAYPIYGLGLYENVATGSFARNVQIFQGRMFISGFLAQPLRVAVSELYNTSGFDNYQVIQLRENETVPLTTDPFDFTLSSTADDFINGLIGWQNSLFIFTRRAVFRLGGGDNGINSTSQRVSRISQSGLVNSYSLAITDKSILYLSDFGVYDLFNTIESEDYQAGERSIKIRQAFGVTISPQFRTLPWMSYDSVQQKVYLGYPSEASDVVCTELFVYNVYRDAWTKYSTIGGFWSMYGTEYIDGTIGTNFMLIVGQGITGGVNVPTNTVLLRTEFERYADFVDTFVSDGVTTVFTATHDFLLVSADLNPETGLFPITSDTLKRLVGVNTIPYADIQDITVTWETFDGSGVQVPVSSDKYRKLPNGDLLFLDNPRDGRRVNVRHAITPESNPNIVFEFPEGTDVTTIRPYPVRCWVDNIRLSYALYFIGDGTYTITNGFTDLTAGQIIEFGITYPSYYVSPLLVLDTFESMKRGKYLFTYFDNSIGEETYNSDDVNAASSQDANDLVGQFKYDMNASVGIVYNNDTEGEYSFDTYGFTSLVWDDAVFDIDSPSPKFKRYSLFKETLLGRGYAYQVVVWSLDDTVFSLAGYQIVPINTRTRHINFGG